MRAAVAMDEWRLDGGGRYVVTGVPVLAGDITDVLAASTLRLLLVAVAVMALVLALLFRVRPRLLPLGLALCAAAIVFGGLALLGLPLTMASIAVLPVLLGLAVDYCVQYQARAASVASLATAALATCAGFLVLLLSPVPMVRGFGALLIVGVGVALLIALTAGTAALTLAARRRGVRRRGRAVAARRRRPRRRGAARLRALARGTARLVARAPRASSAAPATCAAGDVASRHGSPAPRRSPRARRSSPARPRAILVAARHPQRVLVVAAALAICGWALDARIGIVSDLPRLVPQDLARGARPRRAAARHRRRRRGRRARRRRATSPIRRSSPGCATTRTTS